ncbi:MAG: signal transduction histidine kinase [Saprospiraceae bacterium]
MKSAIIPENEKERISLLESYQILDTSPESDYDDITKLASEICGVPISLITLIDEKRQWFKSKVGMDYESTPREYAFCAHSLSNPTTPLIINDTTKDERFHDNPLVTDDPNAVFYAGVPLVVKDGLALGNLCVIGNEPNEISESKLETLRILSNQVVKLLELRKANAHLKKSEADLKVINQNLYDFASVVSHDLKPPIRHVSQYTQLIKEEAGESDLKSIEKFLEKIEESASNALELIDGILRYSKSINSYNGENSNVDISRMIESIFVNYHIDQNIRCMACIEENEILTSSIALSQILTNLRSNAIKYSEKKEGYVKVNTYCDNDFYHFEIVDNGIGIKEEQLGNVFNLFYMVEDQKLTHINRSGIGLNIVRKLIQNYGGEISVTSEYRQGSTFKFSLPRNG